MHSCSWMDEVEPVRNAAINRSFSIRVLNSAAVVLNRQYSWLLLQEGSCWLFRQIICWTFQFDWSIPPDWNQNALVKNVGVLIQLYPYGGCRLRSQITKHSGEFTFVFPGTESNGLGTAFIIGITIFNPEPRRLSLKGIWVSFCRGWKINVVLSGARRILRQFQALWHRWDFPY